MWRTGNLCFRICKNIGCPTILPKKNFSDTILRLKMPEVIKSENDPRIYRTLTLNNGLKALLIHDTPPVTESSKSERLSAAALCIGVGSFSDPAELPGLAHFLEHMVFMGSEKYPDENDFDAYVKKHGGGTNAFTDCERTVFYFDVKQEHFKDTLDKFAQFFIHPLMKQDSVDREIKAVDSEYDMALPSDHSRKEQLFGSLARNNHPMSKFMWGNVQSLKTKPEENGLDLYDYLRNFHQRAYSSHYMTLAVQSRESMDTLVEWISEIFEAVPHNQQDRPTFSDEQFQNPFANPKFHKLYKAVPVKNIHQIEVTWALPPLLQHYGEKPLNYLGFLLGHEGKGSILSYLKKKYWATAIDGGNSESNFELNTTNSVCSVCVTLTEEGNEHIMEVLTAIFQYLKMLRCEGPSERVFREIQTIENNSFRFSDQCEPVDYVERLCENMQLFPSEHYLTGDRLLTAYNPELIKQCQDELIPEKASILWYSKSFAKQNVCKSEEEWFHTKYHAEDIPDEWTKQWLNIEPERAFHLPDENEFIATDFDLKEVDDKYVKQQPITLTDTEKSKLWYKKDTKFKRPKGVILFMLKTGIFNQSPTNAVMGDLLTRILEHNLTEVAYAADVASLEYDFTCAHQNGYEVKMRGFSHKLPKLFETVIDYLCDLEVSIKVFDMVKEQLKRNYHNNYIKPSNLATDVRLALLKHTHWMPVVKREYLDSVTIDLFKAFYGQFKSHIFVEGYVHGSFTPQEALELEQYLLRKLDAAPLPSFGFCERRAVELPVGENFCRVQNINLADCNSVIANYYQFGPASMYEDVIDDLMVYCMEEPVFDVLRTREQLGYSVYTSSHNTLETIGFSVIAVSQAYKFSMDVLNQKIEDFFVEYAETVDKMTEEEFQKWVTAMITLKSCQDNNMSDEANRNWTEISDRKYNFDRRNKQIEVLKSLKLEEFRKWYHSRVPSSGSAKKISVQVVGNPKAKRKVKKTDDDNDSEGEDEESSSSEEDADDEEGMELDEEKSEDEENEQEIPETPVDVPAKLVFLPVEENIQDKSITDIRVFKDSLRLYPEVKLK